MRLHFKMINKFCKCGCKNKLIRKSKYYNAIYIQGHYAKSQEAKNNLDFGMKNKKHTKEFSKKSRLSHIGQKAWNKGLTKETDKRVRKYAKKLKGREKTLEHRFNIKEKRKLQILPKKDTSIEVKIQNFLKELNIDFFTHQYMKIEHGYQCDILIPSKNLVIECDGDYWHHYPTGTDIDHIRTKELLEKGFKVLRLWEYEIKAMNINEFKEKIKADFIIK